MVDHSPNLNSLTNNLILAKMFTIEKKTFGTFITSSPVK
ncbi:hypothetical protein B4064_3301 [Caldibacillus thermoamylovorans]|uniref:Uncharacterized protein n=1 Tax=Caldibacillus thermoamylovorans TaxID=35841 RepID=A0ABD4A907_9BACI|nr:hypothetical protein B4064_3301 [Caldibacillus thermoamylovorans]KIO64354.1 hypothetical protein B4166_0031 [Caldibacillus thermoamylovorans]KIO73634.1 hypothetical protein B4167_0052 [Caldibacillus thermoamylovorans]